MSPERVGQDILTIDWDVTFDLPEWKQPEARPEIWGKPFLASQHQLKKQSWPSAWQFLSMPSNNRLKTWASLFTFYKQRKKEYALFFSCILKGRDKMNGCGNASSQWCGLPFTSINWLLNAFPPDSLRNFLPGTLEVWRYFLLLSSSSKKKRKKERNLTQSLVSICLNFNLIFLSWGTYSLLDQKALLAAIKSKKYRPETDVCFLCQAGVEAAPCSLPKLNGGGSSKKLSSILPQTFFPLQCSCHIQCLIITSKWLKVDGIKVTWVPQGSMLVNHAYPESGTSFELGGTWIWISTLVVYKQLCL